MGKINERIGFVCVGQAAGNIGGLLEEKGFPVLYINTSQEDLDTLSSVKHKHHISGGEGCNKDRDKAKKLVIDDYDNIAAQIDITMQVDIIYVVFASGGGTGSGAGPMLIDLLIDDNRSVGAVTVIPSHTESLKTKINCYRCFCELVSLKNLCSCFIIDNNRGDKLKLNPVFVNAFDTFVNVPEKHISQLGNIDKAEVIETLKAHGMAMALSFDTSEVSNIIKRLSDNIYAPLEQDRVVKYISICIDESIKDTVELEKAIGVPLDTFRAYADKASILVSGLSYPESLLAEIYNSIESNKDTIIKNMSGASSTKLDNDFDFIKEPKLKVEKKTHMSRGEIFAKYL